MVDQQPRTNQSFGEGVLPMVCRRFPCGSALLALVPSILSAALNAGCDRTEAAPALPPAAVTVSHPLRREVIEWDEYTGHLEAPETVNLQARVSGFIEQAPFKEGAIIHKGDVLFVIDERPFKADLNSKIADVEKAKSQA